MQVENLRPSYCVWELTLACNQRCGHCGSKAGSPRADELSTVECLDLVRSLSRLGTEVITLSGGEPTLRPDWYEIASEIRAVGMIPNMVTNGYALDRAQAAQMKRAGLANVAVSIDGPLAVHEAIRGRGSFDRTRGSIALLQDAGMSVTVMTTVNSMNLHRLDEIYGLVCDMEVDRWRCQLGKSMGHMETNQDLLISPHDLLILLPKLYALDASGRVSVGIGDSLGYYGPFDTGLRAVSWKGTPQRWAGCQAGLFALGVESDGGIKGCLSMQAKPGGRDPFLEGHLRDRSVASIWQDPQAFAYNRRFSEGDLTGACRKCAHRLVCRGGAKCVAAASTGTLSEDPYCYHRVSKAAVRWPRALGRAAAAATVVCLMGAGPCETTGGDPLDAGSGDAAPVPADCEEVSCEDPNLSDALRYECCAAQPEYGVEPTPDYGVEPTPDYGVEPVCQGVDCSDSNLSGDVQTACCPALEYGVEPDPCSEVCCECEYGVIPQEIFDLCCAEPVDCSEVCCMCDYGVLPQDLYEACCLVTPDYGVEPK